MFFCVVQTHSAKIFSREPYLDVSVEAAKEMEKASALIRFRGSALG